jgi:hypothetical protein
VTHPYLGAHADKDNLLVVSLEYLNRRGLLRRKPKSIISTTGSPAGEPAAAANGCQGLQPGVNAHPVV